MKRKSNWFTRAKRRWLRSLKKRFMFVDKRFYTACDIGPNIRKLLFCGVVFPHPVGVVISRYAKIGDRCKIWQNVTIGAKSIEGSERLEYPVIGPDVIVYAGAVIIGGIQIGEHAVIGANSVVTKDVRPYTIVAGVPAKEIGVNMQAASIYRDSWVMAEEEIFAGLRNLAVIKELDHTSVCIDCGANLGRITGFFAEHGATVYAFEPHPACVKKLEEQFGDNFKVKIIPKAVLGEASQIKLYRSYLNDVDELLFSQSSSMFASKSNVNTDNYDLVEAIDIVEFINCLDTEVDLLKIDVEGAEYQILEKLITTGTINKVRHVLVETHEDSIPEIREDALRVREMIKRLNLEKIDLEWV